jgi:hypothetical protein
MCTAIELDPGEKYNVSMGVPLWTDKRVAAGFVADNTRSPDWEDRISTIPDIPSDMASLSVRPVRLLSVIYSQKVA